MADYGAHIPQEGDVLHQWGPDGWAITVTGGDTVMTTGIESAVTDCLFGGNSGDDGSKATEKEQYWGNEGEPVEYQSRGRFQSMLDGRPITSARLPEYEEAARDDILRQMPKTVISDVTASVSATGPKRLDMILSATMADGSVYTINYKGIQI